MLIAGASAYLVPLAFVDLALLAVYFIRCFATRGYIFSIFNICLFQFIAELVVSPLYFVNDYSWRALWVDSSGLMTGYTATSLFVNLLGFCIFLIMVNILQCLSHPQWGTATARHAEVIDIAGVNVLIVILVVAFVVICFTVNGTFPLFNGQRGFSNGTIFALPYTVVTRMLPALGLYYGIRLSSRVEDWIGFFACTCSLFLTGNRESVFLVVLLPTFLMWVYKSGNIRLSAIEFMSSLRRKLPIVVAAIFGVVALGLIYSNIRSSSSSAGGIYSAFEEMLYGNTFSDIRDGAYVLRGIDFAGGNFLNGKTYQAAFALLAPGHFGDLKTNYLYGTFTTETLFGWVGHFGLRGGWFLEPYFNFGILGVVCFAVAMGYVFARLEWIFSEFFLTRCKSLTGSEVFVPFVLYQLLRCLMCSSEIWGLYSSVLLILLLEFLSLPAILRRPYRSNTGLSN